MIAILISIGVLMVLVLIVWKSFSRYVSRVVGSLFFNAKGVSRSLGVRQHFKEEV